MEVGMLWSAYLSGNIQKKKVWTQCEAICLKDEAELEVAF